MFLCALCIKVPQLPNRELKPNQRPKPRAPSILLKFILCEYLLVETSTEAYITEFFCAERSSPKIPPNKRNAGTPPARQTTDGPVEIMGPRAVLVRHGCSIDSNANP